MAFWLAPTPLVLASRSAARRTLLEAAGIPIELCPADLDERALEGSAVSQSPTAVAALLAREKAAIVAKAHPGRLVLGADQTLAFADQRFSKPADRSAWANRGPRVFLPRKGYRFTIPMLPCMRFMPAKQRR